MQNMQNKKYVKEWIDGMTKLGYDTQLNLIMFQTLHYPLVATTGSI